jgi:hypothetical protein
MDDEKARLIAAAEKHGDFVTGDDGYVMYWPGTRSTGGWSAWMLRALADELDRRNAEWDAIAQREVGVGHG